MGQVIFSYSTWVQRYPEFATVSEPVAEMYFAEAELYLNNTPVSRVQSLPTRLLLLNMITAHLAKLYSLGPDGQLANPLVGRISDAEEGSVSVRAELADLGKAAAYWTQTTYGFSFWQATAQYRTAVYRAPPPYRFPPQPFGLFRG